MTKQKGQPPDDISSAPESGTVRDSTSGNQPSDRTDAATPAGKGKEEGRRDRVHGDDPSTAGEEP